LRRKRAGARCIAVVNLSYSATPRGWQTVSPLTTERFGPCFSHSCRERRERALVAHYSDVARLASLWLMSPRENKTHTHVRSLRSRINPLGTSPFWLADTQIIALGKLSEH